jgi:predicted signal transduction protein with EAL and GGDEF domain
MELADGAEKKHATPALIIIEGPETGKIFPIIKSATFIGRDESAEIAVNDPAVSRKHILVEADENHICCIDLHSTNGTFVNSQKINKINLKEGDKIKVGNTLLKFSYQDSVDQKYQDKIYQMITFDELTSLYNPHNMFVLLDICFKKVKQGEVFSVLFIDIDYFKKINDLYGHLSGSKVLSDLGQIFLSNIRSTDFACRYGGEEFVSTLAILDLLSHG